MSTLTNPSDKDLRTVSRTDVVKTPFYLSSAGQPLFAWLHATRSATTFHHGIVICPPLGFEQLHSHRSLRHLADSLCNDQTAVLRFDWHGTGDSAGSDSDPQRCTTWQANVQETVRWLRNVAGCSRISVVGVRMGASLAAMALQKESVDDFVAWGPIPSGRRYVREMMTIDLTGEKGKSGDQGAGDIEAAGFLLTRQTAMELSQINLAEIHPQCKRLLLAQREDRSSDNRLQESYLAQGIAAEQISLPGMAEMLAEPHRGEVPYAAIEEITKWLHRGTATPLENLPAADGAKLTLPRKAIVAAESAAEESSNISPKSSEMPVQLAGDRDLWGILSEPETKPSTDRPAILILNAGAAYRIGPGRMTAELARRLAGQGYCSLRIDLNGLGDSHPAAGAGENDPYSAHAFRDVEATLEYLRAEKKATRVVVLGLCSGAYTAFQSAAQLSDPSFVESIMINPLTYYWKTGMTIDDDPGRLLIKQHYYLSSVWQPRKWIRLLTGRTEIGLGGAVQLLVQRWKSKRLKAIRLEACATSRESRIPSHPEQQDLPGDLDRVLDHGRKLTMFFATTDPGYSILNFHARRKANELTRSGQLRVSFIENADHTFSRRAARSELFDGICEHLRRTYP